jgi:hypothetical protein
MIKRIRWWLKDFWEFFGQFAFFGLLVVVFLGVPVALINSASCRNDGDVMGVRSEFRLFGGCYLSRDGQMLPRDRWFALESIE